MAMDVVIEGARIVDGTGAPWFRGAVGVADGRIERIARERDHGMDAAETVGADDAMLAPGFIDTHSHSALRLFSDPELAPKTRQGITTEVVGQDGYSMAPMYREGGAEQWERVLAGLEGRAGREWTWGSVGEYLDAVEGSGVAPNVATLVGHGTVRFNVMGMDDRAPADDELEGMGDLVEEALEGGAIGLSTGLVYSPQVNASTDELRALAARLAPYGRPFVAHVRSERWWLWEAMDEFVDIGAEYGVPLHHSHFKVGTPQQGRADRALELVETARDRGVEYTADAHPYVAGSTMLSGLLPPWTHAEGPDGTLEYLRDEASRKRIRRDIEEFRIDGWDNQGQTAGWDDVVVTGVESEANADLEGETVADIAAERGVDPVTAAMDLLVEEDLEVSVLMFYIDEADVERIVRSPHVGVATDGLFGGKPHPRTFGTYPRILGEFVRERKVLSLEDAVHAMSAYQARAMGLEGKGVIREGADADLVVFDPMTVESRATYEEPNRYPRGIAHVLVDGEFVVRDEEVTGATPGGAVRA